MKLNSSKNQIQKIGHKILNGEPLSEADEVAFAEFRTKHGEILQNFRMRLNNAYIKKRKDVVVVGRLKKRETIINKIKDRHSKMDLVRMHDIAGLRLFFNDIATLRKFRNHFVEADKSSKYRRTNENDKYDYIAKPNKMGYRGIHDVYEEITDDPIKMKLELQYRTWVQHSWATTLEIWDSAYSKKMKFGTETDKNVVDFFRYVSEVFARFLEQESFMKDLFKSLPESEITWFNKLPGDFNEKLYNVYKEHRNDKQDCSDDALGGIITDAVKDIVLEDMISKLKDGETVEMTNDEYLETADYLAEHENKFFLNNNNGKVTLKVF